MARNILVIPAFTVASESAFSTRWRVLDPHRTFFKPYTIEVLICAHDWFDHDPATDYYSYNNGNALNNPLDILKEK